MALLKVRSPAALNGDHHHSIPTKIEAGSEDEKYMRHDEAMDGRYSAGSYGMDRGSAEPMSVGGGAIKKKRKPVALSISCPVCGGPAPDHVHFGGQSCYSCRAFFRRTSQRPLSSFRCRGGHNDCVVTSGSKSCIPCRLRKCLKIGMDPGLVKGKKEKKDVDLSGEAIKHKDAGIYNSQSKHNAFAQFPMGFGNAGSDKQFPKDSGAWLKLRADMLKYQSMQLQHQASLLENQAHLLTAKSQEPCPPVSPHGQPLSHHAVSERPKEMPKLIFKQERHQHQEHHGQEMSQQTMLDARKIKYEHRARPSPYEGARQSYDRYDSSPQTDRYGSYPYSSQSPPTHYNSDREAACERSFIVGAKRDVLFERRSADATNNCQDLLIRKMEEKLADSRYAPRFSPHDARMTDADVNRHHQEESKRSYGHETVGHLSLLRRPLSSGDLHSRSTGAGRPMISSSSYSLPDKQLSRHYYSHRQPEMSRSNTRLSSISPPLSGRYSSYPDSNSPVSSEISSAGPIAREEEMAEMDEMLLMDDLKMRAETGRYQGPLVAGGGHQFQRSSWSPEPQQITAEDMAEDADMSEKEQDAPLDLTLAVGPESIERERRHSDDFGHEEHPCASPGGHMRCADMPRIFFKTDH